MKITACWIAKNEGKVIAQSINSVKDIVDDIVVVDTGSDDDTVKIAEGLGARVFRFEWISDFSAAKNFALSKAEHGLVIFLDADEYFEPPLNKSDRKRIVNAFESTPRVEILSVKRKDIELADGSVKSTGVNNRIIRHNGKITFKGKIHEEMVSDGKAPVVVNFPLTMKHTGYSSDVLLNKMERNSKMLESALEEEGDTYGAFSNRVYLMREYEATQPEKSFENWKKVAGQTANWEYGCQRYRENFRDHLMRAINVAAHFRDRVSRKYVYEKLILTYKKSFRDYILTPLIEKIYLELFDMRDDLFMEGFDAAIEESHKAKFKNEYSKEEEVLQSLYTLAANAAWKRGENVKAANYAYKGINEKETGENQAQLISIILDSLRGKDPVDIVQAISGIYKKDDYKKQRFLIRQLMRDDMQAIYIFFMRQLVASGKSTLDELLYYSLLAGGLEQAMGEAQKALSQSPGEATFKAVGAIIFIAAVALDVEALYRNNPQGLSGYARILEAYFSGEPLENIGRDELTVLRYYYPYIAFLGGETVSKRFLKVFKKEQRECFVAKERYYRRSRKHSVVLDTDISSVKEDDWNVYSSVIMNAIFAEEFELAMKELKRFLNLKLTDEVLDLLLMLADVSGGDIRKEARSLYDKNMRVYEDIIDMTDIMNTGIIMEKRDKKAEHKLAGMTANELAEQVAHAKKEYSIEEQMAILEKVAGIYKEQKYMALYEQSLIRLIACGFNRNENTEKLRQLFHELGNEAAAGECGKLLI